MSFVIGSLTGSRIDSAPSWPPVHLGGKAALNLFPKWSFNSSLSLCIYTRAGLQGEWEATGEDRGAGTSVILGRP